MLAEDRPLQPRLERAPYGVPCEARQGSRPWQRVMLDNLSQNGFQMTGLDNPFPGLPVKVRLPGMQVLSASIRWQRGDRYGCEFTAPLHVAVYEHLVRRAQMKPLDYM